MSSWIHQRGGDPLLNRLSRVFFINNDKGHFEMLGCRSFKPGLGYSRVQLWSQRTHCGSQETSSEEWPHCGSPCRQAGLKSAGQSKNRRAVDIFDEKPGEMISWRGVSPVRACCGVSTSCEIPAPSWCGEAPLRRQRSGECCSAWLESPHHPGSLQSTVDLLSNWPSWERLRTYWA